MNSDISLMLDIAAELQLLGMTRLPQKIVELADALEHTIEQSREYAIEQCAMICSGYANDFADHQFESMYAAGRFDQAKACAINIRKLHNEGASCLLSQ